MAKEDFCYTHYDGDEARDMTHMNRLERGAYTDIRVFQRKVGHLTIDQIKKVLGNDFEACWPSIELVMKQDSEGKFYIEWLENSLLRAKSHSKIQSENGKNGGRPRKNKAIIKPEETQLKANQNPNESQKKPLGDGYGDGYEDEIPDGGTGEENIFETFAITDSLQLPSTTLTAAEQNQFTMTGARNTEFLQDQWKTFLSERINDPPEVRRQYRQLSDLTRHYLNWIRTKHPLNGKQNGKRAANRKTPAAGEYTGL